MVVKRSINLVNNNLTYSWQYPESKKSIVNKTVFLGNLIKTNANNYILIYQNNTNKNISSQISNKKPIKSNEAIKRYYNAEIIPIQRLNIIKSRQVLWKQLSNLISENRISRYRLSIWIKSLINNNNITYPKLNQNYKFNSQEEILRIIKIINSENDLSMFGWSLYGDY